MLENKIKAILLINEAIDLLKDVKFMYVRSNLHMAINEINKIKDKKNKDKKIKISTNPNLSLKMVEKILNKEKKIINK